MGEDVPRGFSRDLAPPPKECLALLFYEEQVSTVGGKGEEECNDKLWEEGPGEGAAVKM